MPNVERRILPILLLLASCSDRQIEPDYSELIADACMSSCPVTTECSPDPYYSSVEECITKCSTAETWDVLNQCDTRVLEGFLCVGRLECEQYEVYLMSLENGDLTPPADYECTEHIIALQNCDPDQPFEEPE
ncbi:hypothetical protein [Enhygromyxa salina]|uniref:Lipoprotein n=1 Tax=Enhygromyxa salina TaxID=215803 RepID=A0A2S9YM38_9BACT|nr:hypothetical protein [Enhygromyxa salina]PRQ06161.1 hypothetical protein ENSA7_41950 [Enhygromyxa salina]